MKSDALISDALIAELEQEAPVTRRLLERLPADRLGWRPHEKSLSLGQLALHLATAPGGIAEMASHDEVPMPSGDFPEAEHVEAVLSAFDASVAAARDALARFDDEAMSRTWRIVQDGRELIAMPRAALCRTFLLNHWYHHRGQLTVYLRLLDVALPSVYGPTADDNPFQ